VGQFLDQFLLTMPETQRQKLMELLELKQRQGIIKSDFEVKLEMERLLKELDKRQGQPTFKARHQSEQTNSADFNTNLDEISFDLMALFSASSQIDQILSDNHQLSRSLLADIRKKIYVLDSQLQRYQLIMKNTDGFVEGIHEQFKASQYTETNETDLILLRKDRYGQSLDGKYNAENVADSLQLASYVTIDQLKNPYGRKLAKIEVLNRTGSAASNSKNPIDYAIDGSVESFWAEVILADEPITHDISTLWENDFQDYPKDGAICELEISLNGMTTVSEITFDPYCAYPLEIVSVHGYESTDHDGKMHELISPNHENPYQRSKKSVGTISYQFPSVDITKLRILIRQENYVKENFIVNMDQMNNMELWDKMAGSSDWIQASKDSIADKRSPGESMAEFDKKNQLTGWSNYLDALKQWASQQGDKAKSVLDAAKTAMDVVRTGNYQNPMQLALRAITGGDKTKVQDDTVNATWKATSKLSYLYGFYDISVAGRKFLPRSIYVSKPLPISGNAKLLSLSTEEKHHDVDIENGDKARITDIEYYIAYKKNPDPNAWKPILPSNKDYVQGELLLGSDVTEEYPELNKTIQFSFRFPIISADTVVLRRDGVPVPRSQYVISTDGKKIGIVQTFYSASSIYTVDYKPVDDAFFVKIEDTDVQPIQYINSKGETGESFATADDNNSVTLEHAPYVFRSQIFTYDQSKERYSQDDTQLQSNGLYYPVSVRVNGMEYKNITDYTSGTYDKDRLQQENEGHTFAQVGNKIFFGSPAFGKGLTNITVDYYYLTSEIRLKAILRRNDAGNESVTPSIYNYSMKCLTYDTEVRDV
jgi:hypothetical protein